MYGETARPRVVFVLSDEEESELVERIIDNLAGELPSTAVLTEWDFAQSVRQKDWDVVVLWKAEPEIEEETRVLQYGAIGRALHRTVATTEFLLHKSQGTVATRFAVPPTAAGVAHIVKETLIPSLLEQRSLEIELLEPTPTIGCRVSGWTSGRDQVAVEDVFDPFVVDPDGEVVAGRFAPPGQAEWWFVPEWVEEPWRWLDAAIRHWRTQSPEAFPVQEWREAPQWQTAEERRIAGEIDQAEEQYRAQTRVHESQLREMTERLQVAKAEADGDQRELLTAQGESLVAAVDRCLTAFGFAVRNMDNESVRPGDKLEDLRISDDGWTALLEVRGYKRGAQANDLIRLGRFVARFARDAGRLPDAVWYVVNHHLAENPDTRPLPLVSNPAEVEEFREGDGLVLDSRDLFHLWDDIGSGRRLDADVRTLLRGARGRLISAKLNAPEGCPTATEAETDTA